MTEWCPDDVVHEEWCITCCRAPDLILPADELFLVFAILVNPISGESIEQIVARQLDLRLTHCCTRPQNVLEINGMRCFLPGHSIVRQNSEIMHTMPGSYGYSSRSLKVENSGHAGITSFDDLPILFFFFAEPSVEASPIVEIDRDPWRYKYPCFMI